MCRNATNKTLPRGPSRRRHEWKKASSVLLGAHIFQVVIVCHRATSHPELRCTTWFDGTHRVYSAALRRRTNTTQMIIQNPPFLFQVIIPIIFDGARRDRGNNFECHIKFKVSIPLIRSLDWIGRTWTEKEALARQSTRTCHW